MLGHWPSASSRELIRGNERTSPEKSKERRIRREIFNMLKERYSMNSFVMPYSRMVHFPMELTFSTEPEFLFIRKLRSFGVRFIHDIEISPECSCVAEADLLDYFRQHQNPILWPCDYEQDHFGDMNFHRFLLGKSDNVALLHFARRFLVIGLQCREWFFCGDSLTDQTLNVRKFSGRGSFLEALIAHIDREFSSAWSESFLMCPLPYPPSMSSTEILRPRSVAQQEAQPEPAINEELEPHLESAGSGSNLESGDEDTGIHEGAFDSSLEELTFDGVLISFSRSPSTDESDISRESTPTDLYFDDMEDCYEA